MKKVALHIIAFVIAATSITVYGQDNNLKGYRIDGDTIVFSFDKRDYNQYSADHYQLKKDFKDLDIESVVVSGEFNNWSRDKWYMHKIDDNRYELRKSIGDFTDEFSWEFKFVVNNDYWAEPTSKDPNIAKATKYGMRIRDVYNLKMYTAYPTPEGNARFKLRGFENAKTVILSGSFNKWNENLFKMNKVKGGWELILQMKPDVYEYRFIVDGQWMEDPDNISKIPNEFHEFNSVINIMEYTAFKLRGFTDAKKVVLSGSFNNWNEQELIMEKKDYGWKYVLPLKGGKHHYKFIVDGQWITDPYNSVKEYDNDGNINSVCMVK